MVSLPSLSADNLQFNDAPQLIWIRVQDAVGLLWPDNPKLHNVGEIVESILKHGFQELPKYDSALGAIKAGNGRVEVLATMEKEKRVRKQLEERNMPCPRGLAVTSEGDWVMPLLIGTDAPSRSLAESYAIDSNNLTMAGGDFNAFDYARMWDPSLYLEILSGLKKTDDLPVTVDVDDLSNLDSWFLLQLDDDETEQYTISQGGKLSVANVDLNGIIVKRGDVWQLGNHILCVMSIFKDWRYWKAYFDKLTIEDFFFPYGGPYILLADFVKDVSCLVIQPDAFIASHIIRCYQDIYSENNVKKII